LKQIVTVLTRGDAILDKIYTNMDKRYGQPNTSCPVGNADPNIVICEPLVDLQFISEHRQIVTTQVIKQNERIRLKDNSWEDLYHLPSCEEKLQMFRSNLAELTDTHFLRKTVVRHNRQTMRVGHIPRPNSSASTCMEGRRPSVVQKQRIPS